MGRSRYVKAPQPPESARPLYEAMMKVMSGAMTVTEAAASVGLSRLRFQTRMHRGLHGLLTALEDQRPGPKPTSEVEASLRQEVQQLRQENAQLTRQVQASARMMGVASEWMRKGLQASTRRKSTKPTAEASVSESDDEGPAQALEVVTHLRSTGVRAPLASGAVGISAPTARRWLRRRRDGVPLRRKRGPRKAPVPASEVTSRIELVLERTRCGLGAAALGRMAGVSRRTAAAVKSKLLTRSEAERRRVSVRVSTLPGVIRGFDAMDVGGLPVLVSADAGVPFRTSIDVARRYDAQAVAAAVERDFARHGPPLVWRVDRWRAHVARPVLDVLHAHQTLVMHGPPHCPRFYGQLERQNREHRAWFDSVGPCSANRLMQECTSMREAFNELIPRRTLGWRSSGALWRARPELQVDRQALAEDVEERKQWLMSQRAHRVAYPGLVERLAIEAALIARGLLRLTKGGWC
jgi:hypothetical protein